MYVRYRLSPFFLSFSCRQCSITWKTSFDGNWISFGEQRDWCHVFLRKRVSTNVSNYISRTSRNLVLVSSDVNATNSPTVSSTVRPCYIFVSNRKGMHKICLHKDCFVYRKLWLHFGRFICSYKCNLCSSIVIHYNYNSESGSDWKFLT